MLKYQKGYIFNGLTFVANKEDVHNAKDEMFVEATALLPMPDFHTNADRIRGMSDEELANQLCDLAYDRWYNGVFDDGNEGKRLLGWLRQPAEEVHDGQTI